MAGPVQGWGVRRLVVALALVAACSGGGSAAKVVGGPVEPPTTTTTTGPTKTGPPSVPLVVFGADVVGPAAPATPMVDPLLGDVVRVVQGFLNVTSLRPLTGEIGPGLGHLLLDGAAAQAIHQDRAVVFDEGVPPSPTVTASQAVVSLHGLAGPDGVVQLVVAEFVWDVTAAVQVRRTGELELVPTPSGWQIASYDVTAERS